MATGVSAVKSGFVIFFIPFVFAMYPEILLIEPAVVDPVASAKGAKAYLPGYDGSLDLFALGGILLRLILALYLLSSALNAFDRRPLASWEIALRLGLAVVIMFKSAIFFGPAVLAAVALIWLHTSGQKHATQDAH